MTGPAEQPALPSTTEDTASVPGWVEKSVNDIFAALPGQGAPLNALRDAYLDCLAGAGRGEDIDAEHDSCRQALLDQVTERKLLDTATTQALTQRLEALEADITANL
ncbi:hypothetical protein K6L44_14260 [Gluconacetobacter entanii]|uniref:hypothetical protein n=1 Tax=Gluconacetobacter entanii TaxID=108528 RepID=UPI001C93682C|nr:hypothetical protein [Gluconacetobacter entanii]MBY4641125.1 hypothetical protein [Gluconacetobacter entanii]MCW4580645.1 hypothetical protein [Gluconacetobacter entanii]MCW4583965.1 hypothetical protein [Gluconacetobacter entanii]MCW4587319.1 hypothetical protein [Gluconacetobacter entanii]